LSGESQDLSQRADDNDIAAATLLPGVDFDPRGIQCFFVDITDM
jgi:hypothetical protein